ncbi:phosphonate metabolism transcriptional regulator PhnF [Azoarcus taiwanensis]|uniref:Phosphonate metabolism transcriptional regulator PhnF n=1 Tax=Azoarcus taiwanensis TaxID=666964 RepID=A0A972JD36_9RHOO|nr:phosphonate metabolism transcriptional regulator PhnF [Azoarcus taiwanensis]
MERVTGIALWRQIEESITREIRARVYKPGDKLPTETSLAAHYGVNRHTLRRAMAALQEAGLIRVEQGRGTFVQEDVVDYRVGKRTRFSENIASRQRLPSGRLLQAQEVAADTEVAKALGVVNGERMLLIEMLREVDGTPLSVATHYFPKARCEGLIEALERTGSLTQALFSIGIKDYTREQTRVTTRLPTGPEARLLDQSRGQPLLVAESINVDPGGIPIEYVVARFAGQRIQFVFSF